MNFEIIEEMKVFYNYFLDFIDNEDKSNEIFNKLTQIIKNHNFILNKQEMRSFLAIIQNISQNHIRNTFFYDKIFKVLRILLIDIKQIYSDIEICKIFKSDKKILMFLMKNEFITFNDDIKNLLRKNKQKCFIPYLDTTYLKDEDIVQKRECGENDNLICEYIRNDSIVEFVRYITINNIPVHDYKIPSSIYETNSYLLKNEPDLIEYAAFFGSIRIFKYLLANGAKVSQSLWDYAIHSRKANLIHLLEDHNIEPSKTCIKESIKCHHNELANYFINRRVNEEERVDILAIKYNNYEFIPTEFADNESTFDVFITAVQKENYFIAKHILSTCKIDINKTAQISRKHRIPQYKRIQTSRTEVKLEDEEWIETFSFHFYDYFRFSTNIESVSALHIAIENESIDFIKLLLENPEINVNQICVRHGSETKEKLSPLHLAIESNNIDIVKLLCQVPKIDVNIKASLNYNILCDIIKISTPIHDAISSQNHQIVDLLSHHPGININEISKYEIWSGEIKYRYEEQTPLSFAIENQNIDMFKTILSNQHINVNSELIEFYIPNILNVDGKHQEFKERKTPLHFAIKSPKRDFVDLLLSNQSLDVNAFYIREYVQNCVETYKEIRKQIKTPIYMAIEMNNKYIADRLLLTYKVDLNLGLLNIGSGQELSKNDAPFCHLYMIIHDKFVKQGKKAKTRDIMHRFGEMRFNTAAKLKSDAFYNGGEIEEEDLIDDLFYEYRIFKDVNPRRAYYEKFQCSIDAAINDFENKKMHEKHMPMDHVIDYIYDYSFSFSFEEEEEEEDIFYD